ncbi:hypothetical protein REPUB_Repub18cG0077700 [Reevesia pubescens]
MASLLWGKEEEVEVKLAGLNLYIIHFPTIEARDHIHLWGVSLDIFSQVGLSYVSSALEIPLSMDKITATLQRLTYAHVFVEIDVNKSQNQSDQVGDQLVDSELLMQESVSVSFDPKTILASTHVECGDMPRMKKSVVVSLVAIIDRFFGDASIFQSGKHASVKKKAGFVNRFAKLQVDVNITEKDEESL